MNCATLFAGIVVLSSCGVTTNHVVATDPDGSIVQAIDCRPDHPEKCQQRAEQLCRPLGGAPIVLRPLAQNGTDGRWSMTVRCTAAAPR